MSITNDHHDLFGYLDEHVTRPKFRAKTSERFYPSEASVKITDADGDSKVIGGCQRASYFRLSGEFEGTPHNTRTEWIFLQGKIVEQMLVEQMKEAGLWVADGVRFTNFEYNISGELDVILREPETGQIYGGEIKSFYGYMAEKEILGNKSQKGRPKMSHLLQTLVYLWHFKDRLPYFRMIYFSRGDQRRKTFKIDLHQEGEIFYPVIDGEIIRSFTVNDVLNRYKELAAHIESGTIPANDFELNYSAEKIENYYSKGKVAKTKYEKWKKNKLKAHENIGDWQCSYCQFKETCWGNQ